MDEPKKPEPEWWRYLPEWWRWLLAIALAAAYTEWVRPNLRDSAVSSTVDVVLFVLVFVVVLRMRFPNKK